jgi:hypothetical protein
MFELFEAFFIALFVLFGIAVVVGHWLLLGALLQSQVDDAATPPRKQSEPDPLRLAA